MFSPQILSFIRDLYSLEIHGYNPEFGYRVYTEKAIEMTSHPSAKPTNGHRALVAASSEATPAPNADL